jgi:hypothetical protein
MTEQDRRIADVLSAYEDAIALEDGLITQMIEIDQAYEAARRDTLAVADAVKTMGLHDEEVKK